MARKSRELRISQTKKLINLYADAGIGYADRSFRFMNDMVVRLESGKGLSSGQRSYLDNLIDQGTPEIKNQDRVAEVIAASEVDGMQEVASVLKDFAYKIGKGWSLSEKQEAFLLRLLHKATQLKATGRFRPTSDLTEDLMIADSILRYKNSWYWQHRVGTANAYEKVKAWLRWHASKTAIDKLGDQHPDHDFQLEKEPIIDQWACDKVVKSVKNQIKEIKNPRHAAGTMAWMKKYSPSGSAQKTLGLVTGEPTVQKGVIVYPFLSDGEDIMVPSEQLKKRR